jgi:hypothetical protein
MLDYGEGYRLGFEYNMGDTWAKNWVNSQKLVLWKRVFCPFRCFTLERQPFALVSNVGVTPINTYYSPGYTSMCKRWTLKLALINFFILTIHYNSVVVNIQIRILTG